MTRSAEAADVASETQAVTELQGFRPQTGPRDRLLVAPPH